MTPDPEGAPVERRDVPREAALLGLVLIGIEVAARYSGLLLSTPYVVRRHVEENLTVTVETLFVQIDPLFALLRLLDLLLIMVWVGVSKGLSASDLGIDTRGWRRSLAATTIAAVGLLLVGFGIDAVSMTLRDEPLLGLVPREEPYVAWVFSGIGVGILGVSCLLGPAVEEVLFRGIFQGLFRTRFGPVWAVLLSTILFALAHGSLHPPQLVMWALGGLSFAILYELTGTLLAPFLLHAAGNLYLAILVQVP